MHHWECPQCETRLEEYREANRRLSGSSKRVAETAKSWEFEIFYQVWLEAQVLHAVHPAAREIPGAHRKSLAVSRITLFLPRAEQEIRHSQHISVVLERISA
jgi:hypothetical protein